MINPSFIYQTPWLQITEPLGLLYLASYLREFTEHEIFVIDATDNKYVSKLEDGRYWYGISQEQMIDRLSEIQPDLIGISCMFSRKKSDFYSCAKVIREFFPNAIMLGGGTYPSLFPKEVLESDYFDYALLGEAEESFVELVDKISNNKKDFDTIDGIAYEKDGEFIVNEKQYFISDLDKIPPPARDLINYDAYLTRKSILHGLGLKKSASILTSRSCPNRCNFCSMFRIHGPRWRGRSAKNVFEEMKDLNQNYGVKEFFIMDDNFTFQKDRVMDLCNMIIDSKMKIRWNTPNGISIRTLDKELLSTMKKAGCKSICVAIESGDEELRNKVIGKKLHDWQIKNALDAAREVGIFTTAFYIMGMPGETAEKFENTLKQVRELPVNGVAAAFANPLPGTKLYDDCIKNNWTILNPDESLRDENILYKPYIITSDFSEEDLLQREKMFYRTFMKYKFFTIIKDTILFRNGLLYPPFLLRILKDRILRK